jgi:hypothetical protein
MRAASQLEKIKLTTREMQHSEYHRSESSVCSEESDGDCGHDSGIEGNGSGCEGESAFSPSQYRVEKMQKGDEESVDMARDGSQSGYGSDGEEAVEQSDNEHAESDPDQGGPGPAPSNDEIIAQLSQMASKFSQTVEKLRNARGGSSLKLKRPVHAHDGYDVFNPKRKGTMRFSPPRMAPEIIPCSQRQDDDFEEDSTASQCSRTPRRRLLAAWRLVLIKYHADCSKEEAMEAFAEYAEADLARAGPKDDVRPGDDDLGGFKHSNVRFCFCSFILVLLLPNCS